MGFSKINSTVGSGLSLNKITSFKNADIIPLFIICDNPVVVFVKIILFASNSSNSLSLERIVKQSLFFTSSELIIFHLLFNFVE